MDQDNLHMRFVELERRLRICQTALVKVAQTTCESTVAHQAAVEALAICGVDTRRIDE